jgi:hypothetical protein
MPQNTAERDGHSHANGRFRDHEAALEDHVHFGMGFFTDAYDLFIVGVVMSILKDEWHPSPVAVGLVTFDGAAGFGVRGDPVRARRRHAGPQAHLRL